MYFLSSCKLLLSHSSSCMSLILSLIWSTYSGLSPQPATFSSNSSLWELTSGILTFLLTHYRFMPFIPRLLTGLTWLCSLLFSFYKNKRTTNKTTLSRVSWICSLHYAWGHKFWQNLSSHNNKIQVQFQDLSLTLKSILYLSILQNKNRANYMHFYKSKCKEFSQSPTILG